MRFIIPFSIGVASTGILLTVLVMIAPFDNNKINTNEIVQPKNTLDQQTTQTPTSSIIYRETTSTETNEEPQPQFALYFGTTTKNTHVNKITRPLLRYTNEKYGFSFLYPTDDAHASVPSSTKDRWEAVKLWSLGTGEQNISLTITSTDKWVNQNGNFIMPTSKWYDLDTDKYPKNKPFLCTNKWKNDDQKLFYYKTSFGEGRHLWEDYTILTSGGYEITLHNEEGANLRLTDELLDLENIILNSLTFKKGTKTLPFYCVLK